MKPSGFSEEQIIGILREQEAGAGTADVCRKHGISGTTFYKWKAKYGGLQPGQAAQCDRQPGAGDLRQDLQRRRSGDAMGLGLTGSNQPGTLPMPG